MSSSFSAPKSKDDARTLMAKLKKYQKHLTGLLPMLALALDSPILKTDKEIESLTTQIQEIL